MGLKYYDLKSSFDHQSDERNVDFKLIKILKSAFLSFLLEKIRESSPQVSFEYHQVTKKGDVTNT
jgi:hypothetical protein